MGFAVLFLWNFRSRCSSRLHKISKCNVKSTPAIRASPSRCGAQCKTWVLGPMQDLGAGPNARPEHGASLSSDFMTSLCSVNRDTIVVECTYAVQH